MALVVNILTLEITEHKLYQIVVGILNFDPWPQQQALTQRSMLYIYGKQLRKCWDGQLLSHTFSGQDTRSQFNSTCIKCPFSPVTGSLLFLKQLIPKREIDFKQNIVPDTKMDDRTALCDAYTLPTELACPLGPWDLFSLN